MIEDRNLVAAARQSLDKGAAKPLSHQSSVLSPRSSGLRGTLSHDVPMSRYTSWHAGGAAERMYQPADLEDLLAFLRSLPAEEPLYVVGLGSNLLVRDGGLPGTTLLLHGSLSALHMEMDGSVYAEAGVPGAKLARFAAANDLCGAEFFVGIPGTLGGMLAMNAGCYGSETWEKVLRVQTVDRHGEVHVRTAEDYEIGYRHVALREPPSPQSSDGTTSHSTRLANDASQVAGYPASGESEARGAKPGNRERQSLILAGNCWYGPGCARHCSAVTSMPGARHCRISKPAMPNPCGRRCVPEGSRNSSWMSSATEASGAWC